MLEHAVIQGLVMWGSKYKGVQWLWFWAAGHGVSSAQAAGVHSKNNCMVFGGAVVERGCTVAARTVGFLRSIPRSSH